MTKLGPFEVHPFADAFPLIEGEEFAELVADIRKNGLREPIVVTHDKTILVDGRNRLRACMEGQVDPVFEYLSERYTETQILNLIVSKNLARRQLNPGQKAMLALKYEQAIAAAVKTGAPVGNQNASRSVVETAPSGETTDADLRPKHERASATKAARTVGASGRAVQQAKAVTRDAPDLADKVRSGEVALDAAYKQARERKRATPRPEPAPKPGPVMLTLRTHDGREVPYPKPKGKAAFTEQKGEGISWAAWSWNPVTGCLHGCDYCYARSFAHRYSDAFPAGFTPLFHDERLDAPANTTIPAAHRDDPAYRRVFVCSMADLYGRWVPDEWIAAVHEPMNANSQWDYLLLTKFPARYVGLDLPPTAWLGTSVDEQKRVRIAEDAFRQVDGVKVKWLSLEPLKEPLEFTDLSMFDWVVIGAQTETYQPTGTVPAFAPPYDWVKRIYDQAREAGCRVHMKPNLVNGKPGMQLPDEYPDVDRRPELT